MKIARLISILVILLNKGSVTARELAERFEVSTRTIYRDVDALSSAGIPIYATQGSSGGISLMEDYLLDRTLITDSESEGLLFALKTLQAVQYPEVQQIFDKLGGLFKHSTELDWLEVDFAPWGRGPSEEDKFNLIRRGILEQRPLEFQYIKSDGHRSKRIVEPIKLYFKGAGWYIWAWCQERRDLRTFRISRIRNLSITDQSFDRDIHLKQSPETDDKEKTPPIELKLRFQPRVAYRVYDDFDDDSVHKNPDGTLETSVSYREDDWVYGYLLSFGPDVEVLEPPHIRHILKEKMVEALRNY